MGLVWWKEKCIGYKYEQKLYLFEVFTYLLCNHNSPRTMIKIQYSIVGLSQEASRNLVSHLSKLVDHELVGISENSDQLLDVILSRTPNLIYVNVDTYSKKDFDFLVNTVNDLYRSFLQKPFLVALATSEKQAYNCIKHGFYYYLIRPTNGLQIRKLDSKLHMTFKSKDVKPKTLCLKTYGDYRFIEIKDILFLKADNNSTEFFMKDQTKIVAYKTLKYFEAILPKSFRRIHQSFVINQNYITRIHLGKSECHLKPLKMRLPFSKSYRKSVSELAASLSSNAIT